MLCCDGDGYVILNMTYCVLQCFLPCYVIGGLKHKKERCELLTDYMACRYTDDLEVFQRTHQCQHLKNEDMWYVWEAQKCGYATIQDKNLLACWLSGHKAKLHVEGRQKCGLSFCKADYINICLLHQFQKLRMEIQQCWRACKHNDIHTQHKKYC